MELKKFKSFLLEDEGLYPQSPSEPSALPQEQQNASLDLKVDSYLVKYEKDSLPTSNDYVQQGVGLPMNESFTFIYKNHILGEAPEDDSLDLDAGMDDPGSGAGDETDGTAPTAPSAPQVENPRFNAKLFAGSVARLVENYETLLDPRTTILNRVKAYIQSNYDNNVAENVMEILRTEFQISTTQAEDPHQPIAAGAWDGVGGGGGG